MRKITPERACSSSITKVDGGTHRVAASLLNAIELPVLIHTSKDYVALAIDLATHAEKLQTPQNQTGRQPVKHCLIPRYSPDILRMRMYKWWTDIRRIKSQITLRSVHVYRIYKNNSIIRSIDAP